MTVFFAIVGTCGLILLSVFDVLHHKRLHDGFLLFFIAGYIISAIFICAEYQRLGVHFRQHRILRLSFWAKLTFIIVEIILSIVFATTSFKGKKNAAAVFEWIIALTFAFYVLTFFMDLLPAVRSAQERTNVEKMHKREVEDGVQMTNGNGYGNGVNGRHTPTTNL